MSVKIGWAIWPALFLIARTAQAQSAENETVTSVFRANVLNPGLSYEVPVGSRQTIIMYGGLQTGFGYNYSSSIGSTFSFSLMPVVGAEYRYYYNGSKRQEKGRRTALNSMNYLAPVYNVLFTDYQIDENAIGQEDNIRPVHTTGIVWGIQRNYKSRISLDLNVGGGYEFGTSSFYESDDQVVSRTTGRFTIITQVQFGFWLNKR